MTAGCITDSVLYPSGCLVCLSESTSGVTLPDGTRMDRRSGDVGDEPGTGGVPGGSIDGAGAVALKSITRVRPLSGIGRNSMYTENNMTTPRSMQTIHSRGSPPVGRTTDPPAIFSPPQEKPARDG